MGTTEGGMFGPHKGKVGNLVYYQRKGKNVVRVVGQITKAPTLNQLISRQEMSVSNKFCKSILPFAKYGFAQQIVGTDLSEYNVALSYTKKNALKGEYPELSVDYEQVLLSAGPLLRADALTTVIVPEGLKFTWHAGPELQWPDNTDQAMLLVYFPELNKTVYQLFGAVRSAGTDVLPISAPMLEGYFEAYIAFISADRKRVSDSVYAGSFNKPLHP